MQWNQDIQDGILIGKPPGWLLLHGNKLLTGVFLFCVILAGLISYNDVIKAEIVVTSSVPPIYVSPVKSGMLSKINVRSGELVNEGMILAEIENAADSNDVYEVLNKLDGAYDTISRLEILSSIFPQDFKLGPVQGSYIEFFNAFQAHISFIYLQRGIQKGEGLQLQQEGQRFAIGNQKRLLTLSRKKLVMERESFEKQKALFEKGVISRAELNSFKATVLDAQQNVQNNSQSLALLSVESSKLDNEFTDNSLQILERGTSYLSLLRSTKQQLVADIAQWEKEYILKSPSEGNVSVFDIWEKYQHVEEGEFIFSIVPAKAGKIIGKLSVPVSNSGKIKEGQRVIIKLNNYPYREWGSLESKVAHISDVPKKGEKKYYSVYIDLDDLNTSFGKQIKFKQEMVGSAEIVLDEISLIGRIFYQFRGIFE